MSAVGTNMSNYNVIRHSAETKTAQSIEVMAKNPFEALTKAKVLFKGKSHPQDKYEIAEDFL